VGGRPPLLLAVPGRRAQDARQRGDIQPGDIAGALGAFGAGGDLPGTSPSAPSAHGGSKQREAAFEQGYNSGQGAACQVPALPTSES
jgi:predicted metalloprotease